MLFGLSGLYLGWRPLPNHWESKELQASTPPLPGLTILVEKWIVLYLVFYGLGSVFVFIVLLFINFFFPNPFLSSFLEVKNLEFWLASILLFPVPFLHTLAFITYYRRAIGKGVDRVLLRIRQEEKPNLKKYNIRNNDLSLINTIDRTINRYRFHAKRTYKDWVVHLMKGYFAFPLIFYIFILGAIILPGRNEKVIIFFGILVIWTWIFTTLFVLSSHRFSKKKKT
ncbi:MAG: hypothetical protein ACFFFG_15885 [Candidatus Thorarchaeota archaeon]